MGAKTDFRVADMPVRLNLSAYNVDYKDIQRATSDSLANGQPAPAPGVDTGALVVNAEAARIRGAEVELAIRPVRNLDLSGSYSYTDAKYKRYFLNVPADPRIRTKDTCNGPVTLPSAPGQSILVDLSCIPFQYAPKHQFNIHGRYTLDLGDTVGILVAAANYSWVGSQVAGSVFTLNDNPTAKLDSYGLLNLSLEWNSFLGSSLDARLFMTNATNKLYRVSSSQSVSSSLGFASSIYGEPRMYGGSLRYRF